MIETLPHDATAEQAALGCALASKAVLREVADLVTPADFYSPIHEQIFAAALKLDSQGRAVDPVTVAAMMEAEKVKGFDRLYLAELVGGAVSLGASTDMHCAVANEVRVVVADLRAERDALAAEVQRSREQKPYLIKTRALAEDAARRRACTVAPLYLAPVVRDHSGVIAQCEEALREWDRKGPHCSATSSLVAVTLTKARNALRGAS